LVKKKGGKEGAGGCRRFRGRSKGGKSMKGPVFERAVSLYGVVQIRNNAIQPSGERSKEKGKNDSLQKNGGTPNRRGVCLRLSLEVLRVREAERKV